MRKHTNIKKLNQVGFFILSIIILLFIFLVPFFIDMPEIYLVKRDVVSFSEGWMWSGDGYTAQFNLPYFFDVEKSESLVIKNTIPEHIPEGSGIALKSYLQSVVAKIDGKIVYEVGNDRDTFLGRDFGKFWVFIELESEHKGKEIELSFFSHRTTSQGYVSEIFIATRDVLFAQIFSEKSIWNALYVVITVSGFLIMLIFFVAGIYREKRYGLFYLGAFAFIMGNLFLGESGMLQLLTKNTYYVTRISLLMTLLAPAAFSLYIRETVPMKNRFLTDFITTATIINSFFSIAFEYLNILGLSQTLSIALVLAAFLFIYYTILFSIEVVTYKNKRALKELKAMSLAFTGASIEIVFFYRSGLKGTSFFLLLGIVAYLVILVVYQIEDYGERRKIREEKEFFEKMAYTDGLTRADNRAKYIRDIEAISDSDTVFIIQADVDRLKYINDCFGHAAGDRSIIDTFKVLKKHFAGIGRVYRAGGDEFSVIVKNKTRDEIDAAIENIRKDVISVDSEREYDFSISIGAVEYDPALDESIYAASIRADHKMYDDKKRLRNTVPKKMPNPTPLHK